MEAHALRAADSFSQAHDEFFRLEYRLQSEETLRMSHSDLEGFIEKEGREVLRQLLQAHLDLRASAKVTGPVTGADGLERTHHREGERKLETLLGGVTVTRDGFGARGKPTLFPLDADLNLPKELYSFGVRRRAAEAAVKGSFDEAVKLLAGTSGAEVPKRQLEELVFRAAVDFDGFNVTRRADWDSLAISKKAGKILVLTFDGKGVPMRREDLREATRKAAEARRPKLEKRLTKGEKRNSKRMAQVAAVYTIAPFVRDAAAVLGDLKSDGTPSPSRPRPEGKRVWASVEKEPAAVIEEAFQEALSRDRKRKRQWVVLVDGNADQIRMVKAAARRHGVEVALVLDVIHVLEYLWCASYVFNPEASAEAEAWVTERLLWLLCGQAGQVAASIRRSATKRGLTEAERKPADRCADYITKHRAMLRYDKCLEQGFPIATGVIEGACRYLVRDRMEITGARWSLKGAEAVLRLRSLWASGDLEDYWRYHDQMERVRNHHALYAGNELPALSPPEPAEPRPTRGHLRVVK